MLLKQLRHASRPPRRAGGRGGCGRPATCGTWPPCASPLEHPPPHTHTALGRRCSSCLVQKPAASPKALSMYSTVVPTFTAHTYTEPAHAAGLLEAFPTPRPRPRIGIHRPSRPPHLRHAQVPGPLHRQCAQGLAPAVVGTLSRQRCCGCCPLCTYVAVRVCVCGGGAPLHETP